VVAGSSLQKRDIIKPIAQLNGDKFLKSFPAAAMETLSIIAYKAPVTKGQVEAIRGGECRLCYSKIIGERIDRYQRP
jgi:segregation and condensation protein B